MLACPDCFTCKCAHVLVCPDCSTCKCAHMLVCPDCSSCKCAHVLVCPDCSTCKCAQTMPRVQHVRLFTVGRGQNLGHAYLPDGLERVRNWIVTVILCLAPCRYKKLQKQACLGIVHVSILCAPIWTRVQAPSELQIIIIFLRETIDRNFKLFVLSTKIGLRLYNYAVVSK